MESPTLNEIELLDHFAELILPALIQAGFDSTKIANKTYLLASEVLKHRKKYIEILNNNSIPK
jgi:hypothetical protein